MKKDENRDREGNYFYPERSSREGLLKESAAFQEIVSPRSISVSSGRNRSNNVIANFRTNTTRTPTKQKHGRKTLHC